MLAVNLNYGDGVISQFSCNYLSMNENDFFYGSKGYIGIHKKFWESTKATLYIGDKETTEERPFRGNGFEYQIDEAAKCINESEFESPIMPHNQTFANMEIMEGIRKQIGLKYSFE